MFIPELEPSEGIRIILHSDCFYRFAFDASMVAPPARRAECALRLGSTVGLFSKPRFEAKN
jgi:hypothetical protein